VHVDEGELSQQVLVEARCREKDVFVGVERFGDPLITAGVKAAVRCVAEWLEARGLKIERRSY
jgi:tRNA (guanine-N7-)-methyltransferase